MSRAEKQPALALIEHRRPMPAITAQFRPLIRSLALAIRPAQPFATPATRDRVLPFV